MRGLHNVKYKLGSISIIAPDSQLRSCKETNIGLITTKEYAYVYIILLEQFLSIQQIYIQHGTVYL